MIARHAARLGRILREVLLTLAALGGVACVILAILAFTGGYSLIMFKTGSMSPEIPAGSVALVQKIPASEITIGDVVTVDRGGALPITHRVTSVAAGQTPEERIITMRGDANDVDDPLPYTITDGRIVRGSVPHLAHVIVWFGNPWVLGGITIGAAALVTWAFWPREPKHPRSRESPSDAPEEDLSSATGDDGPIDPQTRRERRLAGLVCIGILVGSGTAAAGVPAPAEANSSVLTMTSDLAGAGSQQLDPTTPLYWHIAVDAGAAPDEGALEIELSGSGDPAFVISAEVRACSVPWQGDSCTDDERMLHPIAPVTLDDNWMDLFRAPTPAAAYLRLALTGEAAGDASATGSLTIRATAHGTSTDETINGSGELPETGGPSWTILAAPAAVLVGIGVALIAASRRRANGEGQRI